MVLKTSCINCGRFIPAEAKSILPADLARAKTSVKGRSMLISRMNTPDLVGEVGYVPEDRPDLYLPDRLWMASSAASRRTDMRWLTAHLSHGQAGQALRDTATGTSGSMKNISKTALRRVLLPTPQPEEQEAIADALSDVDEAIAAQEAVIAKKRAFKTATMQALLSGTRRLPGFSEEWEAKAFGQLAMIRNEKVQTKDADVASFCVELEHIESSSGRLCGWADARARNSMKYRFHPSDVLFGRLRPYLRKYWYAEKDGVCSTEIWPLIPRNRGLIPAYIHQIIQAEAFIEAASTAYGTHMPRADWKFLSQMKVKYPTDRLEQEAISEILTDMDLDLKACAHRLDKLLLVKVGMMQQLLTGKIRLV